MLGLYLIEGYEMNSLDKMEDYDRLKQERDELAAQVEVMRRNVLGVVPFDNTQARLLKEAVNITPSSATHR
jgi:hypothetical protein